jgi:hypothetical protein
MDLHLERTLDATAMAAQKRKYFEFIRSQRAAWFNADGSYAKETENDRRITFWIFPALVNPENHAEHEWALNFYKSDPCWQHYNIFTSSAIAANLVRERAHLSPELVRMSEEHLAKFTCVDDGRKPCAGINDYMFHGYNDNMPAMATRQMIFAGDVLGRKDFTDRGLFNLEGLCGHLQRRGLISEHTSSTYTPITLTCLMDIAECSTNAEAREMALACGRRVMLDILGHFHQTTGSMGGIQTRAYTVDLIGTTSTLNTLLWYLTSNPLVLDPTVAFSPAPFRGPIHHGRCKAFSAAAHVELFSASYHLIDAGIVNFGRTAKPNGYTIGATADYGSLGSKGLAMSSVTTAVHHKHWALASSDTGAGWSGHKTCLQGVTTTNASPESWRDRVNFWEYAATGHDYGELTKNFLGEMTETDNVDCAGEFRTLQKNGTAMSLGLIAPRLADQEVSDLRYGLIFGTYQRMPDEFFENDEKLPAWDGEAKAGAWQFLRFGEVYIGIRAVGIAGGDGTTVGKMALPRRVVRNSYVRLEIPLVDSAEGKSVKLSAAFRRWVDFGLVLEVADSGECGSFADFRTQCQAGVWELYHQFGRHARYQGRHGELYISDSPIDGSVKVMAIDGEVPQRPALIEATGLDPQLVALFPDKTIKQRRLLFVPGYAGTPYYPETGHVLCEK